MESLKKRRSSYGGAVTRVLHKQERLLDSDPSRLDMAHLMRQMESVQSSSASFVKVHQELLDFHAEEVDEELEMEALDSHEDTVTETLSIIQSLMDLKTIHMDASNLDRKLVDLEEEMLANPDVVYPDMRKKLEDKLASLESAVHHSTISPDHAVARSVQAVSKRILKLSPTETKSDPHSIGSTTTIQLGRRPSPKPSFPRFLYPPSKAIC